MKFVIDKIGSSTIRIVAPGINFDLLKKFGPVVERQNEKPVLYLEAGEESLLKPDHIIFNDHAANGDACMLVELSSTLDNVLEDLWNTLPVAGINEDIQKELEDEAKAFSDFKTSVREI